MYMQHNSPVTAHSVAEGSDKEARLSTLCLQGTPASESWSDGLITKVDSPNLISPFYRMTLISII